MENWLDRQKAFNVITKEGENTVQLLWTSDEYAVIDEESL